MDHRRFDELSRRLAAAATRRDGVKAALGALLGGAGLAALDAGADAKAKRRRGKDAGPEAGKRKRRRKKCTPACPAGQRCVKGACACENGGTACGAACCLIGQRCEGGQCVSDPAPDACIAAGEPCKDTGRRCCDGRVCASGQGGDGDVACYVPKTGACASTAECVYGMSCRDGRCEPPSAVDGLATPCSLTNVQGCSEPGAVCTSYTGAGAPDGTFCTLPLQKSCSGDPDCTCYKCWYSNAVTPAGRQGRASANTRACCHVPGQSCASDGDCCLGLSCVGGTCAGTMCLPDDAEGCDASTPCCNPAASCLDGICKTCVADGPSGCDETTPCCNPAATCRAGVCSLCAATFEPTDDAAVNGSNLQTAVGNARDANGGSIVLAAGTYAVFKSGTTAIGWDVSGSLSLSACPGDTVTIVPNEDMPILMNLVQGTVTLTGLTIDANSRAVSQGIAVGDGVNAGITANLNQLTVKGFNVGIYVAYSNSTANIDGGTYCSNTSNDVTTIVATMACTGSPTIGTCNPIAAAIPPECGCGGTCPS